jgi:hypothetical protein
LAAAVKLTAIVAISSQPMMTAKVMNIRFSPSGRINRVWRGFGDADGVMKSAGQYRI